MIYIRGKIPIEIHSSFWILSGFLAVLNAQSVWSIPVWIFLIFISILVHELGHAVTASIFGNKSKITMMGIGGLSSYKANNQSAWKNFLITLNGPLAGFALYLVFLKILLSSSITHPLVLEFVQAGVLINFIWSFFNLLPIFPLDGGQLLKIAFEGFLGITGLKIASVLSTSICGLLGVSCLILGLQQQMESTFFWIGLISLLLLPDNLKFLKNSLSLTKKDRDPRMQKFFNDGFKEFKLGRWEESLLRFQAVRGGEKKGELYQKSSEYVAEILSHFGQNQEAYEVLAGVEKNLNLTKYPFFQKLAFLNKDFTKSLKMGEKYFGVQNHPEVALTNALSLGQMGQGKECALWLKAAVNSGLEGLETLIKRKEFDQVRGCKDFLALYDEYQIDRSSANSN